MPKIAPFVGRKEPLKELNLLSKKKTSSLIVIQGRRRIGKSRLVREFGRNKNLYIFSGLPPTPKTTAQTQREAFASQLSQHFALPGLKAENWADLFSVLAKFTYQGKFILLFDEISWMGNLDPDFLGLLKNAWDIHFSQNPGLMLILCGSVSMWIEDNIINSTGFMGRISSTIFLKELSMSECNQLLTEIGFCENSHEKCKVLGVTGGVPRYLEEIHANLSADENIKRLCFKEGGFLFKEFNQIFSDLFSKRAPIYKEIVEVLIDGHLEYNNICEKLNREKSGLMSEYLNDLIKSGFIRRDFTWNLKENSESRLSHFRLSDNYIRFYLKYIEKNKGKIEAGHFNDRPLSVFPGWEAIMGLQFENLVLNNREYIWDQLNINPADIVVDNPFFQRKTEKYAGCQIDYLIQTKYNTLFACELKFSKKELSANVILQMKEKLDRLSVPRGFSCCPVLIHINGVHESIIEENFLKACIDFSKILEK